ncbi:MAG: LacI family DNA-binding transcriptional regulator [Hyphomicrobiaceae bacterium]
MKDDGSRVSTGSQRRRSAPRARPNVADVARRSGVSVATVSRAFNAPGIVSDDVRERVLKAASDLGYAPNAAAKALRLQRTHIVGAIVPTLNYAIFASMLNAFQAQLAKAGHMLFLATTGFDNRALLAPARQLVERGAEALLIVGRIDDPALTAYLAERRIPVVTTYSYLAGNQIPSIGFDNDAASRELIGYLLDLGHRHLAMITASTQGNDRQQARVRAFGEALAEAGIRGKPIIVERTHAIADGASALREIRTRHPEVTAIVCNSDVLAIGALAEAKRMGLRVPGDLSITGHDDQEFAGLTEPALTTIAVPAEEMGVRAAEALLEATRDGRRLSPKGVELPTRLVIRGSTGKPRGRR